MFALEKLPSTGFLRQAQDRQGERVFFYVDCFALPSAGSGRPLRQAQGERNDEILVTQSAFVTKLITLALKSSYVMKL